MGSVFCFIRPGTNLALLNSFAYPPLGIGILMQSDQTRLLALALLEIRGLLADYLGSDVEAVAAHLAYALHNEADAAFNGVNFQTDAASLKIAAIDQILGVADGPALLSRLDDRGNIMSYDAKPE
ncbi:hypothetical protein PF66_05316 [Pseudomonas asplenii]|uniref:Uncharacterized protein n=2 Tax=Pseudomonas asplenii TaxID=53407 RepID=A0A0M9GD22_9PSED|nr:hypothetical protein PF66_05316 [Pseudomonas fuscovaginae]